MAIADMTILCHDSFRLAMTTNLHHYHYHHHHQRENCQQVQRMDRNYLLHLYARWRNG